MPELQIEFLFLKATEKKSTDKIRLNAALKKALAGRLLLLLLFDVVVAVEDVLQKPRYQMSH